MRKRIVRLVGAALLFAGVGSAALVQHAAAQATSGCRNVQAICQIEAMSSVYASVARTAAPTDQANQDIAGFAGLRCLTNITLNGGASSLTTTIQGYDDVNGEYYTVLSKTGQNDTATHVLTVGPGVVDETGVRYGSFMPKTYRVHMVHGDSQSITYSVACGRLPD